jgi:type I restriction enzyme S subunit
MENVPKLRFSEFNEPWTSNKLEEVVKFKITNSFSRENLNYEKGEVKNIHYGDIHTKFQTLFDITNESVPFINSEISIQRISSENYCTEGDIIFADASEDLIDVGKSIEIINLNNEKLLSGLHTLLARPEAGLFSKGFLGYLLKSNDVRKQIQKESQGSKVLSINTGRLSTIIINYPLSTIHSNEQAKIASFLTAVDEKLQALKKKKELLETYKKGMMQQIFCLHHDSLDLHDVHDFKRENNEKNNQGNQDNHKKSRFRPLRFKQDDGSDFPNWEMKKLGEVCEITIGEFVIKTKQNPNGKYPVFNGGISPTGYYDDYNNDGNKIIVSARGANAGFVNFQKEKYWAGNSCYSICLLDSEQYSILYFYYFIKMFENRFIENQQAANIPSVSKKDAENFEIYLPSINEQTKIANFLSAIDEKIKHCQSQIEKTEQWKKGLLQQMFC